ncbi:MAG: hypothetical protein SynsKO_21030 [Synoicihabitans sp.]
MEAVEGEVGGQGDSDGTNDIFFSDTKYGDDFGGFTVAVALTRFEGSSFPLPRVETDVIFRIGDDLNWNSYRGPKRNDVDDLRRVLIHELGHSIGLRHPDQFGQNVEALMNAFVSDLDTVATDDILGGQSLYGVGVAGEPGGGSGSGGGGSGGGGSSSEGKLSNLSVRAKTGGQFGTLILGFASAEGSKEMLIRGMGPTLADFEVPNPIPDPNMEMFSGTVVIDQSNDWQFEGNATDIRDTGADLGAFAPTSSREAILLRSVDSGAFTVQVRDRAGSVGEVLIEAYDANDLSANSRLTNLSTRTEVGGAAGILTAGFVIDGEGSVTLLIRGVGPTLTRFNVPGAISNPKLRVLNSSQQEVGANDNWTSSDAAQKATIASQIGAFALDDNSLDAALLITLEPGVYTVLVEGVGTAAGNGLVEIYEVR